MSVDLGLPGKLALVSSVTVGTVISVAVIEDAFIDDEETSNEVLDNLNTKENSVDLNKNIESNSAKDNEVVIRRKPVLVDSSLDSNRVTAIVENKESTLNLKPFDNDDFDDYEETEDDKEFLEVRRNLNGKDTTFKLRFINTSGNHYNEGTIGKVYGRFLISPYAQQETDEDSVYYWWKISYAEYLRDKSRIIREASSPFRTVNEAYSRTNPNALNKVCESIYRKLTSTLLYEETEHYSIHNLRDDLWDSCSSLSTPPKFIVEGDDYDDYDNNTIGDRYETVLLAIDDEGVNEYVWRIKQHQFYKLPLSTFSNEGSFRKLREEIQHKDNSYALRYKCEDFYKLTEDQLTSYKVTLQEVIKYCSYN